MDIDSEVKKEAIARTFLGFQLEEDRWAKKIDIAFESIGGEFPDSPIASNCVLLDVVCDLFDFNRWFEYELDGEAYREKSDWFLHLYEIMIQENDDIDGFIDVMAGRLEFETFEDLEKRYSDEI